MERRGVDAVNKVKIQNENLERGKQQLEEQLTTLHGELHKQQDVMKRLGKSYLFFSHQSLHILYVRGVMIRLCRASVDR